MTAQITPGTTFVSGGTYTAGHFNDNVRQAVITDIDRSTVDQTAGTLITRSPSQPPAPYFKEAFVDTTPGVVQQEPVRAYSGAIFDVVTANSYYFRFNNGNGSALIGSGLQASASGSSDGVAFAGISALATGALIGVADRGEETAAGLSRLLSTLFGFGYVKVVHTVTAGDYLGPSAQNGILTPDTTYNTERDTGSFHPVCIAQAMETSADAGVKLVLAKIFR